MAGPTRTLNCKTLQMIPDRKWSPEQKYSPSWPANDPEPQMIPDVDRKWSRRKGKNGLEFGYLDFFKFLYVFIFIN